jgi:uncharacterized protein YndB with AHSA1/START domain
MSITSVDTDYDDLTVTLIADFDAPIDQVWELWSDPRKLERWWGPPGYPASFEKHELAPGGAATYRMTGPEGDSHRGAWRVTAVDPPRSLEFTDAFADQDGTPIADMPVSKISVSLTERDGGTRMELRFIFESSEHMAWLERRGAFEIFQQSVAQMDAILAADGRGSNG